MSSLEEILEDAYTSFARKDFINDDPILIPHRFQQKEDIEIAGFLTATIAWGQRKTIIQNANKLLAYMDNAPHEFITQHQPSDRQRFESFVHRTFNCIDAMYFMEAMQHLYLYEGGLEKAFQPPNGSSVKDAISHFHEKFFTLPHLQRTKKHVSNPSRGSSSKRLNMFLRWMVRPALEGVDFGIWSSLKPSELMMPLDVHTGTVGRKLGLLTRKQNDWKAVEELTSSLRAFDATDPVKYDFALFGLGVSGKL